MQWLNVVGGFFVCLFLNSIWLQCKIRIFFPNFKSIHTYGCPRFFRLLSFSFRYLPSWDVTRVNMAWLKADTGWTEQMLLISYWSTLHFPCPTQQMFSTFVPGKTALFGESFPTLHNKTFFPPKWLCLLCCTPGSFKFSWLTLNWQLNHYRFQLWQNFCLHGHSKLQLGNPPVVLTTPLMNVLGSLWKWSKRDTAHDNYWECSCIQKIHTLASPTNSPNHCWAMLGSRPGTSGMPRCWHGGQYCWTFSLMTHTVGQSITSSSAEEDTEVLVNKLDVCQQRVQFWAPQHKTDMGWQEQVKSC